MPGEYPVLHIRLLGAFQIERDGELLTGAEWRGRQMRTILKVLAMRANKVVPVDQLLELLWPAEAPNCVRRHLHVRLSQLRHALQPDNPTAYIQTLDGGYCLHMGDSCRVDLHEFQKAVNRGRQLFEDGQSMLATLEYEKARELYRGDFLEEDLYQDWTLLERERLRELNLLLLTELADCYAQQGHFQRSISLCQQVLTEDACREAGLMRLMLYHYYAGEQAQALRVYEQCKHNLELELGVQPLPETVVLAEQIRSGQVWAIEGVPRYSPQVFEGRPSYSQFSLANPPFVGRNSEYSWLIERWRCLKSGVVLIEGESGSGKTRLIREFLSYVQRQGVIVWQARANREDTLPYTSIIQALSQDSALFADLKLPEETLAVLAPLFNSLNQVYPSLPILEHLPPEMERERLFQAFEQLLQYRHNKRTILVIDEAHYADPSTIILLARLADKITILLTCCSEVTPPEHALRTIQDRLLQQSRLAILSLDRLNFLAIQQIIQQLTRTDLPELAAKVMHKTHGNPLFTITLLQHLIESGVYFVNPSGQWEAVSDRPVELPDSIENAIEARLMQLKPSQQHLFDLAVVAGSQLTYALLQQASNLEAKTLLELVDSLIDLGLLFEPRRPGEADLVFTHDTYRNFTYAALPELRRRHLHSQVAVALQAIVPDPDPVAARLAYHFQHAAEYTSAFTWWSRASHIAKSRFAYDQAKDFYQHALDLHSGTVIS